MTTPADPYQPPQAAVDGLPLSPEGNVDVPDVVVKLLGQTRPWVKLVAILVFVVMALVVLAVAGMGLLGNRLGAGKMGVAAFGPLLILMLFYVPPAIFLWSYAASIKHLQAGGGRTALESALRNQKSFWKYVGIFSSMIMLVYGLILVFTLASGALFKH